VPIPNPVALGVGSSLIELGKPRKHADGVRIAGFLKVRNEIIREGNLFRVLGTLDRTCDSGVVCDDASTDGTTDYLKAWVKTRPSWHLIGVPSQQQDWRNELRVKQHMLEVLHREVRPSPDWIFWLDGDELLEENKVDGFRKWVKEHGHQADIWGFPYVQLWRSSGWERTDSGFADAQFWKLWKYRPELAFQINDELHGPQFPQGASPHRAQRAPFEIVHLGNYGKNLMLKAVQYKDSGPLAHLSLKRHLYFDKSASYSKVETQTLPEDLAAQVDDLTPTPFTPQEILLIERMGKLQKEDGLCVVVVPTHNRGYTLHRALESVRSQTHQNWVCLVLDDGSKDNTCALMREFQRADPRVFYCRYPTNRGGVAMNEIGMSLACEMGEFWMRLGSDDYWEPHKLELDVAAFKAGARACYGPYRDLLADGTLGGMCNKLEPVRKLLQEGQFRVSWANIAVRTEVLLAIKQKYGNFCDPRIRNMEDFLVNYRIAEETDFVWRARTASGEIVVNEEAEAVLHDAVWRIADDGASSVRHRQIMNRDEATTRALIATPC
jgi:glycosyltransferase involved in cell wall biosynthesis